MDNYSLADIAAATHNNDDNGFGIGSGGGIFFLAILFLFFAKNDVILRWLSLFQLPYFVYIFV